MKVKPKKARPTDLPSLEQLRAERTRLRQRKRLRNILTSTISALITVAAVSVLVATLWMPVLRIYGSSMSPTLSEGQISISIKTDHFSPGDVIAFYYNNKILIKRYIAGPGDWVNMDEYGNVYINGSALDEPYIGQKAFGECDITLPYQVPESRIFVMGDNRAVSVDSRSTSVGCIADEQIVGKIVFCVWPFADFGKIG